MNRKKTLLILIVLLIIYFVFFQMNFNWHCPFKEFLGIDCPGCGLTRSLKALLHFNIISSIKYNILGLPIFFISIISLVWLVKDFINNKYTFLPKIYKIARKYYIIIFFILIITMIINNINNI